MFLIKIGFWKVKKSFTFGFTKNQHRLTQDRYFQILRLGSKVHFPVFKIKKFCCKSIPAGNRSPFRFIFILCRKHKIIYFTECYYKSQNEVEDKNRIQDICLNYEYYFNKL